MTINRQIIVDLLRVKLAEIRVANGYASDIGQSVEYAEGIQEEPTKDCVGFMDGLETFGVARGPGREHVLDVVISAAFFENDPRNRAIQGSQDILDWVERNKGLGLRGLSMQPQTMQIALDNLGQLAEAVCELKITY